LVIGFVQEILYKSGRPEADYFGGSGGQSPPVKIKFDLFVGVSKNCTLCGMIHFTKGSTNPHNGVLRAVWYLPAIWADPFATWTNPCDIWTDAFAISPGLFAIWSDLLAIWIDLLSIWTDPFAIWAHL
jgi:hypothetical protein